MGHQVRGLDRRRRCGCECLGPEVQPHLWVAHKGSELQSIEARSASEGLVCCENERLQVCQCDDVVRGDDSVDGRIDLYEPHACSGETARLRGPLRTHDSLRLTSCRMRWRALTACRTS